LAEAVFSISPQRYVASSDLRWPFAGSPHISFFTSIEYERLPLARCASHRVASQFLEEVP
jgi:hypothetical protein